MNMNETHSLTARYLVVELFSFFLWLKVRFFASNNTMLLFVFNLIKCFNIKWKKITCSDKYKPASNERNELLFLLIYWMKLAWFKSVKSSNWYNFSLFIDVIPYGYFFFCFCRCRFAYCKHVLGWDSMWFEWKSGWSI